MRSVILISIQFPPYKGVGGRRWGNLSKALSNLGHKVYLVTADWGGATSFYKNHYPNCDVHLLKGGYYFNFCMQPKSTSRTMELVRSFSQRVVIDPILRPIDYAQSFNQAVTDWIKDADLSGAVVICTGAPFSMNLLLSRLQVQKNGGLLVQDFRDTWSNDPYLYPTEGARGLAKKLQGEAVSGSDAVVAVSETLLHEYTQGFSKKKCVIPNGFDPDIIATIGKKEKYKSEHPYILTHLGSITNGRDMPFFRLLDVICDNPNLAKKIRLRQVGLVPKWLKLKIRLNYRKLIYDGILQLKGSMSQRDALLELAKSDYALLLNSPKLPYALSTKVYEYGALRVPVLSLNYGGEIETYMSKSNLGLNVNLERTCLRNALEKLLASPSEFEGNVDFIDSHSYKNLARRYSDFLNKL